MRLFFNVLLLLVMTTTYAQNTIEGKVNDELTDGPIVFANIYLPQLEKGTTTDENGLFMLSNLPNGNYKMIVSFIGYETLSLNIIVPKSETLMIALSPSVIEIEEVIISTPFHKLQSENVMKVEQEKIADLKARGAINLSDGLSNIAGVENVSTGISIGKPVIRGLRSNRVLVYTQGVRLENQQYGDEHGLGISDAGIESVEIIKGPASLLYGSDALGGVLYLNPEKFEQTNSSTSDFGANFFSNTNGYSTNLGHKASGEKFKFIFRGGLAEHSDYDTKDYRVTNTRFKERDFKAALGYQISKFKTEFRYNINSLKTGLPEELGEQSKNKTPVPPFQDINNHVFSSKSVLFLDNSSFEFNLGFIYNDRKEFEDEHAHDGQEDHEEEDGHDEEHESEHEDDLHPALQMKLKTFNYDIKYHLPTYGKFETIVGIQGMNQINTNYGEEQLIPDATTKDFGVLAVSHIHFEKVDLQLGVRYDNRNIEVENGIKPNYNSINGSFGIKSKLNEGITARLNFATGFRAPNLAELTSDGVHHGSNRYEIGNPELKNEQNFQTDLSIEFKNDHIELYANAFYNLLNNYIFLSPNGSILEGAPAYNYLQEDAKLYGGEFGLHFHPHPLDWLHIESSFETVTGKQRNGQFLPLIPANTLNNTIRVEFKDGWINRGYTFLRLSTTFNQNNVSTFETSTPGYNLLSAGIGGKIDLFDHELLISLSGNNLTDKKYIHHLSRLKPEGIYNIGRNISVGATLTL